MYEKKITSSTIFSFFSDAQKFQGRNIYNNNFVRGVIPSHNFCRNLIRKYTGSAICVGITTGDLVRC